MSFIARATRDCTLLTVRSDPCGASGTEPNRRGGGVTPQRGHRFRSPIPARKSSSSRSQVNDSTNKPMKMKSVFTITLIALLPLAGFTQTPPAPPQPPQPPRPPGMPGMPAHHEKGPKVPVTYLGVETSQVPPVVSEQLGLGKGLGLVVDYVEPNSPAAAAGVQQNDILKMLNDQIVIEPSQLRKLLQPFPDA